MVAKYGTSSYADVLFDFWSSDFWSSDFWSSHRQTDRQTDRKRCIWAHHAYAQVGSTRAVLEHWSATICMENSHSSNHNIPPWYGSKRSNQMLHLHCKVLESNVQMRKHNTNPRKHFPQLDKKMIEANKSTKLEHNNMCEWPYLKESLTEMVTVRHQRC